MTKFIHIRTQDEQGRIAAHGGVTVAYVEHEDHSQATYAISICTRNDNYDKRRGRQIAQGRLWKRRAANDQFRGTIDLVEGLPVPNQIVAAILGEQENV